MNMEKIDEVWFENNRIYIHTSKNNKKSRPLEAFPLLMDASDENRSKFEIWADGQSIRWDIIDEDIHISSFEDKSEPNPNNEVAKMLDEVGGVDISAFASMIGIKKTKFDLFRYGIWTPGTETMRKIKEGLRQVVNSRIAAVL